MQKRHVAMQKEIKEKVWKKWTSVQMKKKEKGKIYNKIAHVFLQLFLSSNERNIYIEQSRIRLSHYISPIQLIPYTCTS
jgi:ribosomal protein L9